MLVKRKCSDCGKIYEEDDKTPDLFECCADCFFKLLCGTKERKITLSISNQTE
jgi:DNA-directed RNA polymerase subunit RPC12/RpoP